MTAALGSSLLTGGTSLGVVWFQERRSAQTAMQADLSLAVETVLGKSLSIAHRANFLGILAGAYSGPLWTRPWQHLNFAQLFEPMFIDLDQLNSAAARVRLRSNQTIINLTTDVVCAAADVTDAAPNAYGRGGSQETLTAAVNHLRDAHRALTSGARKYLKQPVVDLQAVPPVPTGASVKARRTTSK